MRLSRIIAILRELINSLKIFGVKIFLLKLNITIKSRIFKNFNNDRYLEEIYKYTLEIIRPVIKNYKNVIKGDELELKTNCEKTPIWVFWWQGEEEMPLIIKKCYKSLYDNISKEKCKINLITKDNYKNYTNIPDYILKKVNNGDISLAHFSDIIRFNLLYNYGGLWIDSTIYITAPIKEEIFKSDLFTHRRKDLKSTNISRANWSSYIIGGKKNHILFKYIYETLLFYWKMYDKPIDYFLTDYIIAIGYNELTYIRESINKISYNNPEIFTLAKYMNRKYDKDFFEKMKITTNIYKLTYKERYLEKTKKGEKTFYGEIFC